MYLRLPRQLHLELTNNCNAKCPMCSRTMNPIDKIDTLSFDVIRNSCENIKFSQINYCGNDGDPLLSQEIGAIVNYFAPIPQGFFTI
jgi:molybdenum cofactor biosynthesis enzyme MoaA